MPGGPLKASEETPAIQPGAVQDSKSTAPAGQPAKATNGTDAVPLPLPPPPGGGTGQQGSLTPSSKTDVANITPAAEQSSAANLSSTPADPTTVASQTVAAPAGDQLPLPVPDPPVSTQGNKALEVSRPSQLATIDGAKPATETIGSGKPATAKPTASPTSTAETPVTTNNSKKPDALKKLVLGKSLGSKPVVLVAPSEGATTTTKIASASPVVPITATGSNGLYGGAPNPVQAPAVAKLAAPVAAIQTAPATPPAAAPTGNAYVVQLATFNSKAEANAAYQRLSAKHGAIITRYAPIIAQADVAGSTRYKLNLGPIPSNDAASSVCSALISAGERDCVVRRQ